MKRFRQWTLAASAALGFAGVLFAAAGSHWIDGLDDPARYRQWQAAVLVNLVHAPALLGFSAHELLANRRFAGVSALLMFAGTALFSGSIYGALIMSADGPGSLAPAGGMLLLLGWLILLGVALNRRFGS